MFENEMGQGNDMEGKKTFLKLKDLIPLIPLIVLLLAIFAFMAFCLGTSILDGIGSINGDVQGYHLAVFNLYEFSGLGVVPLIAPMLIMSIVCSFNLSNESKERCLLALLLVTLVAYNASINEAWEFLKEVCFEGKVQGRTTKGLIYPFVYTTLTLVSIDYLPKFLPKRKEV